MGDSSTHKSIDVFTVMDTRSEVNVENYCVEKLIERLEKTKVE